MNNHTVHPSLWKSLRMLAILGMIFVLVAPMAQVVPAYASSVSSASFSGGANTISVSGTLYAKNGGALTLTVSTSSDTKCVEVSGTHTGKQGQTTAKSSWSFSFTAGSGDGVQTVTATAYPNYNSTNQNCSGSSGSSTASYILDNTGPVVSASLSPAPNGAGWNNSNVSISWSATDAGSGYAGTNPFASNSQTANTNGTTFTQSANDRLNNSGSKSVTVKLDKAAPTITGSRTPAANANGWNNTDVTISFTCDDASGSGIKSCTGSTTLISDTAGQTINGTAVDNADNSAGTSVTAKIDKTAPTLSGAPTTSPNGAGWYNGDVTIHWTAADALSGLVASPSNSTISSEGTGLTASKTVSDNAGNSTTATSSPAVKIDKTAPNTTATAPANWNNVDVTISLDTDDSLSGVKVTHYKLDGGTTQNGASVAISAEGDHTLEYWSEDIAGNVESAKSVHVKIDKTPPSINHSLSPAAVNGWNNSDVTVSFTCADTGGSGVASCTDPQTVTSEGANQVVIGTALDNAGNSASDPAQVSVDKTPPSISASPDRAPNGNGWYNDDVIVGFTCSDALSGIDTCPPAQTLHEGAGQSASGTATDAAGNSGGASLSDINVDKTNPTLHGAPTSGPNGNGWYNDDVTVAWTCGDALSGIDGDCPADSPITGEGSNLSAGASVSDLAGNSSSASVDGIKIDRTAPSTLASVPIAPYNGWYDKDGVQVTLNTGADLSGVSKTYYAVDGDFAHAKEYSGPFNHSLGGSHTITFWSVDRAGNIEDKTAPGHSITLQIDNVPPAIGGSRTPAANGFGWNNGPVTVSFTCSDDESGLAGCTDPVTLNSAGEGQSYTGQAQDIAGNTASATVDHINIDLTAPTVSGAPTTPDNAYGWYKNNVTIHWTALDGLSGIDPATVPADSVIGGEGSNLGAGPVSVSDKAGNVGSGSISGIKIDRTPPTISGATVNDDGTPRSPNAAGWFNSAVRVRFTCADALSGVQECASDVVLDADGANQSAGGTATDKADNSANTTKTGIKIDSQAPQTSANNSCTSKNGWCRGSTATVVLTALDQAGLSGVKEIRYSVNGAGWQSANGSSANVNVPLAAHSGLATVQFYAVDNAGNSETMGGVSLKFDNIAPAVTHSLAPPANAAGWNKANVTVHFNATDDDNGSGVDPDTVTPDQMISTETAGTTVNGSAEDMAGNLGTDSVTVKLDKTAPTIDGAAATSPNANGWYKASVTVHFTCADALSGVATCTSNQVLDADGANQSVMGTAEDRADNTASKTVGGISIDSIAPTITSVSVANGAVYAFGSVPAPTCQATDDRSGLDANGCKVTVTGGNANGVGTFSFTASATDKAGNTTTRSGTYQVNYTYRFVGFLQPINDTNHQINQDVSIFKAGSTVPVKFQLLNPAGQPIQATAAPIWLTPAKGSPTTAAIDESVYTDSASSGTTYRWDSTGQQYIYNWGTAKNQVGYYWRIGVRLDDGQTYFVNIGLR